MASARESTPTSTANPAVSNSPGLHRPLGKSARPARRRCGSAPRDQRLSAREPRTEAGRPARVARSGYPCERRACDLGEIGQRRLSCFGVKRRVVSVVHRHRVDREPVTKVESDGLRDGDDRVGSLYDGSLESGVKPPLDTGRKCRAQGLERPAVLKSATHAGRLRPSRSPTRCAVSGGLVVTRQSNRSDATKDLAARSALGSQATTSASGTRTFVRRFDVGVAR